MSEWQPIETAPNDGEMRIFWNGEEMRILNRPPNHAIGIWHKRRGNWYGYSVSFHGVSHWMPLPTPPNCKQ